MKTFSTYTNMSGCEVLIKLNNEQKFSVPSMSSFILFKDETIKKQKFVGVTGWRNF